MSVSTQTDNNQMTMAESVSHELSLNPNPITFEEIKMKSNESCIQQRGSEYQMVNSYRVEKLTKLPISEISIQQDILMVIYYLDLFSKY